MSQEIQQKAFVEAGQAQLAGQHPMTMSAQVAVPQPITIKLDSPTDWLTAVATPIAIALAGALFAWMNQRAQIRSSIASIRSEWARDLRAEINGYAVACIKLQDAVIEEPDFFGSAAGFPLTLEVARHRAAIRVMLDPGKPYNQALLATMSGIAVSVLAKDSATFSKCLTKFIDSSQVVLEMAWRDIKRDLMSGTKPEVREGASEV